jgi:uncharacterized 2Fe-2S/4Fe-4S cluster protein (DUF4445 family)
MLLGMIPDCPLDDVISVGNAAGTGARIALSCTNARREIEAVVLELEKIETATEKNFQEYFINAMALPHKVDTFSNLEKLVKIPILTNKNPGLKRSRSSRRSKRSKTV